MKNERKNNEFVSNFLFF